MNTIEGNKLLADLNGYIRNASKNRDPYLYAMKHAYEHGNLKYHSDWGWLRSVVEEIGTYRLAYPEESAKVCECKIIVNIDILWRRCVDFAIFLKRERPEIFASDRANIRKNIVDRQDLKTINSLPYPDGL